MRLLRAISVLAIMTSLLVSPPARADIGTTPAPPRLENAPLIASAYFISAGTPRYVELYNTGTVALDAREWSVRVSWSNPTTGTTLTPPLVINLSQEQAYIPAKSYVVVGFGDTVTAPSVRVDAVTGEPGEIISELRIAHTGYVPYVKQFASQQTSPMRLNQTSTGYTSTGTYSPETRTSLYDDGFYIPLETFPLAPVEILANPEECSPLSSDLACKEYVKFYNHTDTPISFDGTRLHVGSSTLALGGTVAPKQYAAFASDSFAIPNGGGYIWLEDSYGVKIYANTVTQYGNATSTTHKGQSWALMDGSWQWSLPNPGGANAPLPADPPDGTTPTDGLKPCRPNQYRNPLTNRCKLINAATASLKPCAAGQYRNPETNRCRSIASASASSLTPCKAGQYRNPATNRCKSLSAASSLKPCAAGQERNPATNRCRQVLSSSIPSADFPVEKTASDSKGTSIGWLAFAAVGLLASGYGMWEWRSELGMVLGQVGRLFRQG